MSKPVVGWQPDQPYDALPLLPPSAELESRRVLKRCVEARARLAELNQATKLIPNPTFLVGTLPLLEARASTEIENIVTTDDKVFEHLHAEQKADPATKEALRYRHALLEGFESLSERPLSTATAVRVCSRIKDAEMQVRRVPGTALANPRTGEVIYTPPVGESHLRDLLANWESFLHDDTELDPLVRLAVAHYQFEAIHPFTDGNGRTGRILNSLYLVERGLIPLPVLYLSRYIIENRAQYYSLLLSVTARGEWEPWILYILDGVRETAHWTTQKIDAIRVLAEKTREYVRAALPKIYTRELIDTIFEQPYCRIANVVEAGVAKRQAASTYLTQLADRGVLEIRPSGREKLFINTRLLELVTGSGNEPRPFDGE
ncbi:MAG: Fic family protein [Planctomycetota bacterium]